MRMEAPEFEVHGDHQSVTAYTATRLRPEIEGWQVRFRDALREGVAALTAAPDRILFAEYGSRLSVDFFDLESALFYSLGAAVFQQAAQEGVFFRILSHADAEEVLRDRSAALQHYYHYGMIREGEKPVLTDQPAIRWDRIPIEKPTADRNPARYWSAMRQNLDKMIRFREADLTGPFAVQLTVSVPQGETLHLMDVMKPLLDGVLCAFHRFPGETSLAELEKLGTRAGIPFSLLGSGYHTILGERDYAVPDGEGLRWNPESSRCRAVDLSLRQTGDTDWKLDGKLFAL